MIEEHLRQSAAVMQQTITTCQPSILTAVKLIARAFESGNKLLLCGNGGSAADCQHMATEFVGRLTRAFERPALPAIALTTDTSFLTAYTNDYGYADVFARQVAALGQPGDVLLGISTSGTSINVRRALEFSCQHGIHTIALTGECKAELAHQIAQITDITIAVPSDQTTHIQEVHLAIEHIICHLVERQLFDHPVVDR